MSKKMTPEEVLNSVVEGINTGNLYSASSFYMHLGWKIKDKRVPSINDKRALQARFYSKK
jgi:hypothetical protein